MANEKIDWIKIKNEYINTNISYRKLSEKYNISRSALEKRARKEKWPECREKQYGKIEAKVGQKTADIIVDAEVDRLTELLKLTDEAQRQISLGMSQLNKYLDMFGNCHDSDIIDVSRLKKLVSAMKDIRDIIRVDTSNDMRKLDEVLAKIEGNI